MILKVLEVSVEKFPFRGQPVHCESDFRGLGGFGGKIIIQESSTPCMGDFGVMSFP